MEGTTAIVVTTYPGDPTVAEQRAAAAREERPRTDYVEVADRLGAVDVIDVHHMRNRACLPARVVARVAGLPAGQVVEVFMRRRRYAHVLTWADRIGLPMGLLLKLRGDRQTDVVLVSVLATRGAKGHLIRWARVHTRLRAMLVRSVQQRLLEQRFGVDPARLVLDPFGVDERFFQPRPHAPAERLVCAVGWEARDYETLLEAARSLDAPVELAVGSMTMPTTGEPAHARAAELLASAPPNVRVSHRSPAELRALYARARVVVIPVRDVEFDAGVTALMEAMAMGRPVVATRTRGIGDLFTDGVEGLLVPPGDAAALGEAVRRLLDDPLAAEEMGRAGRALVERKHRMDARTRRIVETVLHGPAGHSGLHAARSRLVAPRPPHPGLR